LPFCGFRVTGNAGFYFGGNPELPIVGLRLQDWDLTLSGGTDNEELAGGVPHPYPIAGYSGLQGSPALPCAVYGTNAVDVVLDGFRVRWADLSRSGATAWSLRTSRA